MMGAGTSAAFAKLTKKSAEKGLSSEKSGSTYTNLSPTKPDFILISNCGLMAVFDNCPYHRITLQFLGYYGNFRLLYCMKVIPLHEYAWKRHAKMQEHGTPALHEN